MIEPNIKFDPKTDDASDIFLGVFRNIENQLREFDLIDKDFQESLKTNSSGRIKRQMVDMKEKLKTNENHADLVSATVDDLSKWMNAIFESQKTMDEFENMKIPDDFIIKFGTSQRMVKSMGEEIIPQLNHFINSYETDDVVRLKGILMNKRSQKFERIKTLEQLNQQYEQACAKYDDVMKENKIAAEEFKKHDELLTNLSSSESYEVVQKAKRQKYVVEEWKKKKQSMLDEIDTLSHEYAAFKNEEKSVLHGDITKKAKAADDEFAKAEEKWKEEIRLVEEDKNVSTSNMMTMMKQLEKDLDAAQSSALSAERKKTISSTRTAKGSSDRTIAKFQNFRQKSKRSLEMSLRKKGMTIQKAIEVMANDHKEDLEVLNTTFKSILNEMREILTRKKDAESLNTDLIIKRLNDKIENIRQTTLNAKTRITQKIADREIELQALQNHITTVQGVVSDIFLESSEAEKRQRTLENELQQRVKKNELECERLKKEIDKDSTFITAISKFMQKIEEFSDLQYKKENDRFPNFHKSLPRSNSQVFETMNFNDFLQNEKSKSINILCKNNYAPSQIEISKLELNVEPKTTLSNQYGQQYEANNSYFQNKNNENGHKNENKEYFKNTFEINTRSKFMQSSLLNTNSYEDTDNIINNNSNNTESDFVLNDNNPENIGKLPLGQISSQITSSSSRNNDFNQNSALIPRNVSLEDNHDKSNYLSTGRTDDGTKQENPEINIIPSYLSNTTLRENAISNNLASDTLPDNQNFNQSPPSADRKVEVKSPANKIDRISPYRKRMIANINSSQNKNMESISRNNQNTNINPNLTKNQTNLDPNLIHNQNKTIGSNSNTNQYNIQLLNKSNVKEKNVTNTIKRQPSNEIESNTSKQQALSENKSNTKMLQTLNEAKSTDSLTKQTEKTSQSTSKFFQSYITEIDPVTPHFQDFEDEEDVQETPKRKVPRKFKSKVKKIPNHEPSFVNARRPCRIREISSNSIPPPPNIQNYINTKTGLIDPMAKFEIWYDPVKAAINLNSQNVCNQESVKPTKVIKTRKAYRSPKKKAKNKKQRSKSINNVDQNIRSFSTRKVDSIYDGSLLLTERMNANLISVRRIKITPKTNSYFPYA